MKDHIRLKEIIKHYMYTHCYGYKNAKPRREICTELGISDRLFRQVAQDLKDTNDVASLSSIGYWMPLLVTNDREEIEALKHSIAEDRSRAFKQLKEADRREQNFKLRYQQDFNLAGV